MLAIYRLRENAYSVTIHQKIYEMTGQDIIVGTLYNTLKQMDRKGYLIKKKGKPINEKGRKRIIYYSISKDGFYALDKARKTHKRIWEDIPEVLYRKS